MSVVRTLEETVTIVSVKTAWRTQLKMLFQW